MATNSNSYKVEDLIQNGALLISDGYRARSDQFVPDGIPFARIPNVVGRFDFKGTDLLSRDLVDAVKRSRPGDVVFTSKGTVGRFALVQSNTPEFVYSPQLCFWRSLKPDFIDPIWLYYWMQGRQFYAQFKSVAGQTDMAEYVSLKDQRMMTIDIPPLSQQRRIAGILGALDDKIGLNRNMNDTLEQMAQALFKSWFVDFDPVRTKAAGRQPAGMNKATADLFPDSFVDTELGKIPKGWEVVRLGDEVVVTRGCSYKSEELAASPTAMVTLKSFKRGGGYRQDGLKAYTGAHKPAQVVHPGELVVSYTDVTQAAELIGRPAIVGSTKNFGKLVISQDVSVVRPTSHLTISYLYRLMMEDAFKAHTYAHSTGTTVLHLSSNALPSFKFSKPSKALFMAFDQVAANLLKITETNNTQSRSLEAIRDTLLPRLLAGTA